jgi:hypothetical protein
MIPGLTTRLSEETLVTATTISPLSDLVIVTGTTNVATIVPPPTFGGRSAGLMIFVAVDGFATVTTGNVATAVTIPVGKTCVFVWSNIKSTWYPGTIS